MGRRRATAVLLLVGSLGCARGAGPDTGDTACPAPPTATPEPVVFAGPGAPYDKLTGLFILEEPARTVGYVKAAYTGEAEAAIRRFESGDGGATWEEVPGCAVGPGLEGVWDARAVGTPSLRAEGDGLTMWYRADDDAEVQRVLRATASDGCAWTLSPEPALVPDEPWAQIAVIGPHVLQPEPDGPLWMYYRGSNYENQMLSDIGVAFSEDGLVFTPWPDNPVLARGDTGWDRSLVADPHVWVAGGRWWMLYAGHDAENTAGMSRDDVGLDKQVGLAVSRDGLSWRRCGAGPALSIGRKADNAFALAADGGLWVYVRTTEAEDGSGGEIVRVWWPGWPGEGARR